MKACADDIKMLPKFKSLYALALIDQGHLVFALSVVHLSVCLLSHIK